MKKNDIKQKKAEKKNLEGPHSDQENQDEHPEPKIEDGDQVKLEVKLENGEVLKYLIKGPKKWYEDENLEIDDEKKWDYLEHHGVTFPEPYIPRKLHVSYDGVSIPYLDSYLASTPTKSSLLGTGAKLWAANGKKTLFTEKTSRSSS